MSSSDMSIISKQMESMSMSMTNRVLRGNKRTLPSRYSPYNSGFTKEKAKQKEDAVGLGVELSIFVAEAVFLLSDDISCTVWFGRWLFQNLGKEDYDGPVVGRLFRVFLNVFATYINKPKNGVNHAIQRELITTSSQHFVFAVQGLDRIVSILKSTSGRSLVKSSVFEYYKQELNKVEEKLRPAKNVSEANGFGFAKEVITSKIIQVWMSLFQETPKGINTTITMTSPPKLHPEGSSMTSSDISIISKKMESLSMTHPRFPLSPYTSGTNLIKEKKKEEVVRLGAELSLIVAETMFLLSNDVRSTVWYGICLCKYGGKEDYEGPVVGRLLRVFQYVFETYTKPKARVNPHLLGGKSIQCELIKNLSQPFTLGFKLLDNIVLILKRSSQTSVGLLISSAFEYFNQELKKLEERLMSVKNVTEANGFVREEIKSNILHLWKSLFEP